MDVSKRSEMKSSPEDDNISAERVKQLEDELLKLRIETVSYTHLEMFGYSTDLRSRTQGRGNYSMFFEKYEPVPKSVQEKVLSAKND